MQRLVLLFVWLLMSGASYAAVSLASDAERAVRRGRELYEFGRWSDARLCFAEARRKMDASQLALREEADYYLAACAVELGSHDAEEALLNFRRNYPGSTFNNEVRFALASHYCAEGDFARARELFEQCDYKALSRAQRERYHLRMGYVAFSEQIYSEAYAHFNRIDEASEFADHATYYRAYIDYAEGRTAAAKEAFQRLAAGGAYSELAPYYLLQIEFREGNYPYVIEHGDALAQRAVGERKTELERILAEASFHLDDYEKTLRYLDTYVASGGEMDRDAAYLKGFSLYRQTRYEEAIDELRKAAGPEDALTQNASYHLADCYLRLGRKQEAMQAFALATNGSYDGVIAEDALFNYAKLQYELGGGLFNGAIQLLSRYLKEYPRSPRAKEARTLLVAAYYNSRNYDAASRAIKQMPSTDAELRTVLQKIIYFRALEAKKAGDRTTARRLFNETVTLNISPRYTALATFWQGEIAFEEGDYTLASTKYNAYLRRAPRAEREYALAWYNLGYCHFLSHRTAQAEGAFNQFLAAYAVRDRYRYDAINRLGDLAYAARRYEQALKHYGEAAASGGSAGSYAAYKRATTLGVMGRTTEQQKALREILRTGKGDHVETAAYELGNSYMRREQYAEAAKEYERFLTNYPSSPMRAEVAQELGLAYLNMGESEKALKAYDDVVKAAPQSQAAREALQSIRSLYVARGDAEGYFRYAASVGVESDLSAVSRDSLSFVAAQKLYLADQHAEAEKSLRSYLKSYPKGRYRADALHYLSNTYLAAENTDGAIDALTELAALSTPEYTLDALRRLSDLTWQAKRYKEAADAARKHYDATTVQSEREAAMTRYVRATVAMGEKEAISKMASDVLGKSDAGTTAQREAKFAWAEQMRSEGRTAAAYRLYKELAEEVKSEVGSAAAYRVIEHDYAEGKGDLEKTEQAVFALSERVPKAYWLAKAYLLLGDLYVVKGDPFQARATYQSVADGYSPDDDGIVEEARVRIKKLGE